MTLFVLPLRVIDLGPHSVEVEIVPVNPWSMTPDAGFPIYVPQASLRHRNRVQHDSLSQILTPGTMAALALYALYHIEAIHEAARGFACTGGVAFQASF